MTEVALPPAAWLHRAVARSRSWYTRVTNSVMWSSDRRFVTLAVMLHITIFVVMAVTATRLPFDRLATSDVPLFNERAAAILAGDWIANGASITPDTPPLVNYVMLVPHLLGGSLLAYAGYFSAWILAAALAIFYGLRHHAPDLARGASLVIITHPFGWATAVLMVQDEALVAAFVAFAFVGVFRAAYGHAGAWTGIGTLVKAWPVVGLPVLLAGTTGRQRWRLITGLVIPAALLLLPFLLLHPAYLAYVFGFYGGGVRPDRATPSGISVWKFIDEATGMVWEPLLVALLAVASLILWAFVWRQRLAMRVAYPAAFILLFLLYPKLHYGYYLILIIVLAPWLARSPGAAFATFVVAGTAAATHLVRRGILLTDPGVHPVWPLLIAAVTWLIVLGIGIAFLLRHRGQAPAGRSARAATPVPSATPSATAPVPLAPGAVLATTLGLVMVIGVAATIWTWSLA